MRALLPSIPGCDLADPANAEHLEVIEKALAQLKDAPPVSHLMNLASAERPPNAAAPLTHALLILVVFPA